MGILDQFAEDWIDWQKRDAELRASLPKTPEEANERFVKEMGWKIHDVLYKLREELTPYFERPLEVPIDAFMPSSAAHTIFADIVNLQSKMCDLDVLP